MRRDLEILKTPLSKLYRGEGILRSQLKSQFEGVPDWRAMATNWRFFAFTAWARFDNDAKPRGVGHIILETHEKEVQIVALGVSKILRRCGVGTRLVQEALWCTRPTRPLVTCSLPSPLVDLWPMEHLLTSCGFDIEQVIPVMPNEKPFWYFSWHLKGEAPAIEQLDPEERATLQWP